MENQTYPHSDITGKVIGCAMEVHKTMKNGYQEVVYQRCMAIEMELCDISFKRELEIPLYYKKRSVGTRRVDFLVDECIMVELKAETELTPKDISQTLNYLEANNLEIALLINFGAKSLQFKRLINNKYEKFEMHD
ncbi:MAG: GxxExxY protein [Ignavibacteriae bacterium]|nr:MAG: GxxExxY protein [Ignavibacteriota bacterium]